MRATYASVWDALADVKEQAADLRVRAELMQQIAEVVKGTGWTEMEAATHGGIKQPRINDLLRGAGCPLFDQCACKHCGGPRQAA